MPREAGAGGPALTRAALAEALARFRMPARIELLARAPALVLDVAHTVESVRALLDALGTHFPGRRVHLVFGCSRDKALEAMLERFAGRCASFTATQARLPRARPASEVAAAARALGLPDVREMPDAWEAVQEALGRARPDEVVCLTGSFYTAGEVRARWEAERGRI